jgi:hypothetical protein
VSNPIRCAFCGAETEYISLGQLARLLGIAETTARRHLRAGRFPGSVRVPHVSSPYAWKVPVSAVLPLLKNDDKAQA